MSRHDNSMAFPEPERLHNDGSGPLSENHGYRRTGLTKREWFAGMALQGLASDKTRPMDTQDLVRLAVGIADALLAELGEDQA